MHIFCFGIGYVGGYWLKSFPLQVQKSGTLRNQAKRSQFTEQGAQIHLFDPPSRLHFDFIEAQATHVLVTIPPEPEGDLVLRALKNSFICSKSLKWLGILSSTSIYGDHQGAWVHEDSPCHSQSLKGQARLKAEQEWQFLYENHGVPVHTFRLSGIYGPGRSLVKAVKQGTARRVHKPGHCFSRIHVEDIIQVLKASMKSPCPGSIYNVADDLPVETREIIDFICGKLPWTLPPLVEPASLKGMAAQLYRDHKKVSNTKIKSDLGIRLLYPTYKEGLQREISHTS